MNHHNFMSAIDQSISEGVRRGILHLTQEGNLATDNLIQINGSELVNFTSCSYLGLEHDERLKSAAIAAVEKYGVQFSESRAYVSIDLYRELEQLMSEIFEAPTIVAPTTTLAHLSAIPVILDPEDAVIADQQLHNSVLSGINVFKANWPIHFEVLRHNRLDVLKERIEALQKTYKRVWYFADGVYSMFGDRCPANEIFNLLDSFPVFHTYIDDAHSMSILGKNGKGYILSNHTIHERMIVASSMAKAFATGGGILVFPNKEIARRVRACGAPFNSSGPLQPATLGAAVASAKIHLTDEIYVLQTELANRIKYANSLFKATSLPLISNFDSGIFFVGTSRAELAYSIMEKMIKRGFLLNIGVFPAVSKNHSGIRFTMTTLQSYDQIERMIKTLNEVFFETLGEHQYSVDQIYSAFKVVARLEDRATGEFISEYSAGKE
ncbi:aminotransferase class I/II-fold pyridoxal phosphate-dependent enzyme [Sphingobacterium puteale]|uniref:Aminotransferase class I/II-fold pyridoxal phosphate-dependent enzyme n=1 Tax=Sphingobacterium puteale TaxID=2420510 RepID=A0A420VRH3_9SPHI|nr:aminotransferase class I/II-fold pyridoxal phosphate-dependent enzyme [Sphingobacterium puteale]RKO68857.1 aminotransferase class I/II-fold pyridoxal phosphate-dependent enzyme [Sphingobacterium puteale]